MSDRARIERLNETLSQLEHRLVQSKQAAAARAHGVTTAVRIAAGLTALLALSNLYFINELTQEVRAMIGRMEQMTSHFDHVADRMHAMRLEVDGMQRNVRLMPVMDAQMREIATHVGSMRDSVGRMQGSTEAIDGRVGRMTLSVADMAARFHGLNRSVGGISGDVNQMALPVP